MMIIQYCVVCQKYEPLDHICSVSQKSEYYGPIGEDKTFDDKLTDAKLMHGEMEDE